MQCPKCGYNSFDYNDSCPRCHRDLTSVRQDLGVLAVRPQPAPFLKALIGAAAEGGEFTFQRQEAESPGADETVAEEAKEEPEVEAETTLEAEAEPAVEDEPAGIEFEMPAEEARPALRVAKAPAKVAKEPSLELAAEEEKPERELYMEAERPSLEPAAEEEEPAVSLEQEAAPALEEGATIIMDEPPARPLRASAVEPPVASAAEPPVEEVSLDLGEEPEDLSVEVARVEAELQEDEGKGLDLADFEIEMDEEKKTAPVELGRKAGGETMILEAEKPRAREALLKVIPLSETMEEELDLSDLKLGPEGGEEDLDMGEIEKLDLSGLDEETEGKEGDFSLSLADMEVEPAAEAAGQDVDISEGKTVILDEAAMAAAPSKTPAAPKKGADKSDEIELDLTDLKIDD